MALHNGKFGAYSVGLKNPLCLRFLIPKEAPRLKGKSILIKGGQILCFEHSDLSKAEWRSGSVLGP